ncbi:MAG: response regulator transcription factor [Jatrophihabitans sp.]|nr:MAG: response regulator transcription factor [Jatrophihabitans sp.]
MAQIRPQRRVLVVDDDRGVRTVVAWQLEAEGHTVVQAADGQQAMDALAGPEQPDLVVLDLSLPGIGGLDVLRRLRDGRTAAPASLPVIVLSGRSGQSDRIVGLDQGADDYLVKPFSPGELAARVRSVLRRAHPPEPGPLTAGTLRVDPATREVSIAGRAVPLTAKEFDLLAFLAAHPRRVFSRAQLLDQVWQSSSNWQGEATVTEHVHRLRRKLEADPARPTLLRTCRGVGYQLDTAPVRAGLEASS